MKMPKAEAANSRIGARRWGQAGHRGEGAHGDRTGQWYRLDEAFPKVLRRLFGSGKDMDPLALAMDTRIPG